MAKLIKILAASLGGGLMLGAGVRLAEAIMSSHSSSRRSTEVDGKVAARLGAIEDRLRGIEAENPGSTTADEFFSPGSRIEDQAAEVAAVRSQLSTGDRELEALREIGLRLRGELRGWLEESVGARMGDVESKLRAESERGQKQMLDAFVDGVQTRVMHRISRLEEEVAGQSAAMTELRECSLRTEQSMQKLLGELDRLILAPPPPLADTSSAEKSPAQSASPGEGTAKGDSSSEPLEEPKAQEERVEWKPSAESRSKSRRWSIFG